MPELAEVETVRRDVDRVYSGDILRHVRVIGPRTVRRHSPALLADLEGLTLTGTSRLGKYLVLRWSDGCHLVGHLRMSGQLRWAAPGDPLQVHTHAVFSFARAGELRFVDPRTFGELFVSRTGEPPEELAHLGPDALDLSAAHLARHLARQLAGRRTPLKVVLTDQRVVAGIGNIYADEICFAARVRPDRPASVGRVLASRLAGCTVDVLSRAIEARGSTLADGQYCDLTGQPGSFQLQHAVYNRDGKPCRSCGRPVARARFGSRSAYWCPSCQR